MKHVKKIVLWSLLVFFVYAIVTQPDKAANIIQALWDLIVKAFQAIGSFFDSILKRN